MIERIRELEAAARALDPGPEERERVRRAAIEYAEAFLRRLPELKAYEADSAKARELWNSPLSQEPARIDELIELLRRCVDDPGLNPASPHFFGYIPGGGLHASAVGDFLASVFNRYAGVHFAGPGAVEMENLLLHWMAGLVGYPEGSAGTLTSGGSIGNLIAIVTAREAHNLDAPDFGRAVVYLSDQTHHCIPKALRIAGLRSCVQRRVPLDERYRMVPEALERAIAADREAGLRPWLVVATAGTTDVGAVDPLDAIGEVASRHGLWYHVDAAYGGFFALVDECRPQLAGMARSDSIVLDPHKGLFLPYGTGAVLVKDREAMRRAHDYRAAYMQDALAEEPPEVTSPAELSPELTRHFRGLRLWLPLKLHGLAPFRACLQEKLWLTRYFHQRARDLGFEVGPEPELTVTTYRWVPRRGDPNAFNQALVRELHREGRVFVSSTLLDGRFVLRLATLVFRTHLDNVDQLLEALEKKVKELERGGLQEAAAKAAPARHAK